MKSSDRKLLVAALTEHANVLERLASGRKFAGSSLRELRQQCRDNARRMRVLAAELNEGTLEIVQRGDGETPR